MLDCPPCPLAAARLGVPPPHAVPACIVGGLMVELSADHGQLALRFVEERRKVREPLT